jgi:hypothetical protein
MRAQFKKILLSCYLWGDDEKKSNFIIITRLYSDFKFNSSQKAANLNWGTILRLDESPFTYQSKERKQNDLLGTKLIGEDYFFNIKKPSRKLITIEY